MSMIKLNREVSGSTCNIDPADVLKVKKGLNSLGYYQIPEFGLNHFGDGPMLNGLKKFQKDHNLTIDGVIKPGGETEIAMNKFLRKASYLSSAAMQGISSGWADEIEGAMSGLGYGIASLNPKWNKTGESAWQAAKRGYTKYRDQRREHLRQGYEDMPSLMGTTEFVSSVASPSFNKVNKAAPLAKKVQQASRDATYSGAAYGLGSVEGDLGNQLYSTGVGAVSGRVGNRVSNSLNRNITGGIASTGLKWSINKSAEQATTNLIENQINRRKQII